MIKNVYKYSGWAGEIKYFTSEKKAIESAKLEGIGIVHLRKNGELHKIIKTEHTAN